MKKEGKISKMCVVVLFVVIAIITFVNFCCGRGVIYLFLAMASGIIAIGLGTEKDDEEGDID